ncbi:MAG: hypothetical protein ACRCY4_07820 [Brevinema sp.]
MFVKEKLLLCLLFCVVAPLRANYPEDVYFFELGPIAWDYFVSQEGSKLSMYRTLEIVNEVFFLNIKIALDHKGIQYQYDVKMRFDDRGNAFLQSLSDDRGAITLSTMPLLFPAGESVAESFNLLLAPGIGWRKEPTPSESIRNPRADVIFSLYLGDIPIDFTLRYREGIVFIRSGEHIFTKTTQRIYNNVR